MTSSYYLPRALSPFYANQHSSVHISESHFWKRHNSVDLWHDRPCGLVSRVGMTRNDPIGLSCLSF
ncbi:hypothetical protein BDV29DRAFT_166618 [Aspergillus leporis]|uniref:Uncharacterized protein n=1 Tax=Aspergillus leporis TaxID=41062 RepID=A0A5N5XCE1_9EURO|nr:hypothetical protein BDV29DRAFT_166618 [Aspergillus leporis]